MKQSDYIIGLRPIIEALRSGREIERIFLKKGLQGELHGELNQLLKNTSISCQYVPQEKLDRITKKNHQGAIAVTSLIEYQNIEQIVPLLYEKGKIPLVIILDGITDVRNFGAIARTAECAGVDAILIPQKGAAQINFDAIKTSSGALYNIPVCRERNLKASVEFLKNSGLKIVGSSEKADIEYYNANLTSPVAVIFGSEEKGISQDLLTLTDEQVRIPIFGKISSLNVSVSVGIFVYEACRQRIGY